MTPSPQQNGDDDCEWSSEAEKMAATKTDPLLAAIIRGIDDLERAREYQQAIADQPEPSTKLMALLNRRIRELRDDDSASPEPSTS